MRLAIGAKHDGVEAAAVVVLSCPVSLTRGDASSVAVCSCRSHQMLAARRRCSIKNALGSSDGRDGAVRGRRW